MQPSELGAIVQAVRSRPGCSLLVFGCAGGCVFVHDCERLPEQNYAARYLGSERLFLKVEGHAVLHGYAF